MEKPIVLSTRLSSLKFVEGLMDLTASFISLLGRIPSGVITCPMYSILVFTFLVISVQTQKFSATHFLSFYHVRHVFYLGSKCHRL